ncbi:MAG: hypothetical protein GY857_07220 [Desulfobacula sp.]|nr:hypothetical protein [Desulfobacula sp.]
MKLNKNFTADKKLILFIVAVLLLIISIIYRVLNPFEQQTVEKLTHTGTKAGKTDIQIKKDILPEKQSSSQDLVSKFLNKPKILAKVYNDLFMSYQAPEKLAENNQINVLPNKYVQERQMPDNIQNNPVQQIKDYLCSYKIYGTYKSENTKAVFLSKDKLVLVAKTGDRLDGKYLIDDIQENYIKIKALDLKETIHLDMREFNNE